MLALSSMRLFLQIIGLIILVNYSTTWVSKIYDALISFDYWNSQRHRYTWDSVLVVVMIQKLGVVGLSFGGKFIVQIIMKKGEKVRLQELPTSQHEDNQAEQLNGRRKCYRVQTRSQKCHKKSQNISFQTSLQLGLLLFFSILLFHYLQSTVNIIYIIIQKCISSLILYIMTEFSSDQKLQWNKIISFVMFSGVIGFSTLIKLVFNQLEGFYSAQMGNLLEEIDTKRFFALTAMIVLDIWLYWRMCQVLKDQTESNKKFYSQPLSILSTLQKTFQLLFSTTKYCFISLLLLTIFTGELYSSIQFIQRHHHLFSLFIQLMLFHFLNQFITLYAITKFNLKVFLIMMLTNGVWVKMGFFFIKSFDIHSVVFLTLGFCLVAVVKNQVYQKTQRFKNE